MCTMSVLVTIYSENRVHIHSHVHAKKIFRYNTLYTTIYMRFLRNVLFRAPRNFWAIFDKFHSVSTFVSSASGAPVITVCVFLFELAAMALAGPALQETPQPWKSVRI